MQVAAACARRLKVSPAVSRLPGILPGPRSDRASVVLLPRIDGAPDSRSHTHHGALQYVLHIYSQEVKSSKHITPGAGPTFVQLLDQKKPFMEHELIAEPPTELIKRHAKDDNKNFLVPRLRPPHCEEAMLAVAARARCLVFQVTSGLASVCAGPFIGCTSGAKGVSPRLGSMPNSLQFLRTFSNGPKSPLKPRTISHKKFIKEFAKKFFYHKEYIVTKTALGEYHVKSVKNLSKTGKHSKAWKQEYIGAGTHGVGYSRFGNRKGDGKHADAEALVRHLIVNFGDDNFAVIQSKLYKPTVKNGLIEAERTFYIALSVYHMLKKMNLPTDVLDIEF